MHYRYDADRISYHNQVYRDQASATTGQEIRTTTVWNSGLAVTTSTQQSDGFKRIATSHFVASPSELTGKSVLLMPKQSVNYGEQP